MTEQEKEYDIEKELSDILNEGRQFLTSIIMTENIPEIRDHRPVIDRIVKREFSLKKHTVKRVIKSYSYEEPCYCEASGEAIHIHTGRFNEYMLFLCEEDGHILLKIYDSFGGDRVFKELTRFPHDTYALFKTAKNQHIFVCQMSEEDKIYEIYHPLLNRAKRMVL